MMIAKNETAALSSSADISFVLPTFTFISIWLKNQATANEFANIKMNTPIHSQIVHKMLTRIHGNK